MQKRTVVLITFLVVVGLIATLYMFTDWFSKVTGYLFGEDEQAKVAECLKKNNAEFYTSVQCAECERQAEVLGPAITLVRRVDCGANKENCPNIKSIPAWYIDGKIIYGLRNLTELKIDGNCE